MVSPWLIARWMRATALSISPHQHGGHAEAPVPLQRLGRRLGSGDTPGRQDRGEEIGVSGTPQEGNVPLSRGPDVPFF